jgi:hypothetical protein
MGNILSMFLTFKLFLLMIFVIQKMGDGEKLVRTLFAVARHLQPSIIFIGIYLFSLTITTIRFVYVIYVIYVVINRRNRLDIV